MVLELLDNMKYSLLFLSLFILTSFTNSKSIYNKDEVVFNGQLLRNEEEKHSEPWWYIQAFITDKNKTIASAPVDMMHGTFSFKFSQSEHPQVDLYITHLMDKDTIFVQSFSNIEKDTLVYAFYPYRLSKK